MEALSDPRKFLSNQDKRAEQLKAIGIDESDINTTGIIMNSTGGSSNDSGIGGASGNMGGVAASAGKAAAGKSAAGKVAVGRQVGNTFLDIIKTHKIFLQ